MKVKGHTGTENIKSGHMKKVMKCKKKSENFCSGCAVWLLLTFLYIYDATQTELCQCTTMPTELFSFQRHCCTTRPAKGVHLRRHTNQDNGRFGAYLTYHLTMNTFAFG